MFHGCMLFLMARLVLVRSQGLPESYQYDAYGRRYVRYDPADCPQEPKQICSEKSINKALGEPCTRNDECMSPTLCMNSTCTCPEGYISKINYCLIAPSYGKSCPDGICQEPYVCKRGAYCGCPDNMLRTYRGCKLECDPDEIPTKSECLKRTALSEPCNNTVQCASAFSTCKEDTCQCIAGTTEYNGECIPRYNCPNGQEPLRDSAEKLVSCKASECTLPGVKIDTCPKGAFCIFPSYQNEAGFCCPATPWCPTGEPLADRKCKDLENEDERCPSETHHCYTGPRGTHCCPLPCPSILGQPAVVVNGTCYPRKKLRDVCKMSEQCPDHAVCEDKYKKRKKDQKVVQICRCPSGFRTKYDSAGLATCRRTCDGSEILVGAECLPVAAPGQKCKHSAQCIGGTVCRDGTCQCPCGLFMYYGRCLQRPTCYVYHQSYTGSRDPLKDTRGNYIECRSSRYRQDNSCPEGHYCRPATVYTGGVCCPLPGKKKKH